MLLLVVVAFGTNYYHQNIHNLGMSHIFLFFFYVLILWFTIEWHRTKKIKHAIALAVVIGIATLSRPTELITVLIPVLYKVTDRATLGQKLDWLWEQRKALKIIAFVLIAIGSVQIIYWKWVSGQWIVYSYNNAGEGFDFFRPHILNFLFSFRKGWLVYTPVMALSLLGFYKLL